MTAGSPPDWRENRACPASRACGRRARLGAPKQVVAAGLILDPGTDGASETAHRDQAAGTAVHLAPCRADCAHHVAPASCRRPRTENQACPGICKPHRCTVMTMNEPAMVTSSNVRPMAVLFCESWLRHGNPAYPAGLPRACAAQPAGTTIFPCACRAFLASQNCRARRPSTLFPPLRGAPRPTCA